jgi:tetratricopeptide (TPR) repeat protein
MQQNQQVQQHHQQTYQPLHQVQLRQSPPRPPTPSRQLHQPQPQPQQQQQQQLPPPVLTHQKPPPGQWETPKSRKHWPDSTKSTLRTKFNFDSHASPFDKSATTNTKPPTPPRSNRSQSPSILKQTALIPEPQPTPRLHEPNDQDELNQHEAEQLNAEGNQLMQKKQFQDALKSYSAALELCPGGPNSHVYYSNRSAAYLSLNDHVNSIRDSESSLELCPDYSKAHSRLGLAYFVSGQYEQAVEAYSIALKYEPDNEWNRSHYEKARKKVSKSQRKSLQERPFDEEPVHTNNTNNDESQEVGDDPAARSAEYIAMREADQYKDAGNAHMSNKEYEEALEKYSQAITISPAGPNSHVYYSNRAAAYCYLGQYDAAADDCMTSIEIKPDYEKAHARLGLSMFFLEDFEGAIEAYGRALELDPNNAASKSYLGKARKRLEELVEAENERKSKIANVFLEQQEELQKAMEEQLKMQGHGSERDSWS